jgi:hypothetical protein
MCEDDLYVTERMEGGEGSWVVYDSNTQWLGIVSRRDFERNYEGVR